MKRNQSVITALITIITLIGFAFGAYAQEPLTGGGGGGGGPVIALPMIQSPDAFRNYALGIATYGSRSVWAESMDWGWPDRVTYTNLAGRYGEEVLDRLFGVEFVYRLTNPEDTIKGYVYLYDGSFSGTNNPNLLFWGYAEYTLAELRTNRPTYHIWMQEVPLPLSNVESAEILVLNEDGQTADRIPLIVRNGRPMFKP